MEGSEISFPPMLPSPASSEALFVLSTRCEDVQGRLQTNNAAPTRSNNPPSVDPTAMPAMVPLERPEPEPAAGFVCVLSAGWPVGVAVVGLDYVLEGLVGDCVMLK